MIEISIDVYDQRVHRDLILNYTDIMNVTNVFFRMAVLMMALMVQILSACSESNDNQPSSRTYYIDSRNGNDSDNGLTPESAWRTLERVEKNKFHPGDTIKFKRGSSFSSSLCIKDSGSPDNYIVLTDYGDEQSLHSPAFTNNEFVPALDKYGNCIRLKGDFIKVENLYFHNTVAELSGNIGFKKMWELGAVYIDKSANNCIVSNNEFFDCGVGIKSYGKNTVIHNNYIHDCNRILKEWGWGPIAIWLGGDYQEVCHNRIFNYSVVDPRINWGPNSYGGGADGGAIEIDDARFPKSNISIHHNYSRDCQGFIEVTWSDVAQNPPYSGFRIHHNVSDDYQQFIALWCGKECRIENNTIIRRKVNANDWGVFNITQYNSKNLIRNNIVVVENEVVIFNLGKNGNAQPSTIIECNLYYAASGNLNIGLEGPGLDPVFEDPKFFNYDAAENANDFSITALSPAIDRGLSLGYTEDFLGVGIPQGSMPDIGAFEYRK